MVTETKKVLALAALIVASGVTMVEFARTPAQADPTLVAGGSAGYAGSRVDGAFAVVADMPPVAEFQVAAAEKGDLLMPLGCAGPFRTAVAAECMDTAYEVESGPYVVVESRSGEATSILTRMMGWTIAGVEGEAQAE